MSRRDLYRFKTCISLSAIHTSLHFYWFIMPCCVFFLTDFSWDFGHSLHFSSHSMIFIVSFFILLSFCAFRILEYLLIGIFFFEILLCIAYIFLWYPFDSRHKYHIDLGTNRIWFFLNNGILLEIFLSNLNSGIYHPATPSIVSDKWIFWKTDCCWSHMFIFPKVSGFGWALPPRSCKAFCSISLRSVSVRGSIVNLFFLSCKSVA